MITVLRPLAHCGCCMLLLLLPVLQATRSEPREPRRWRVHWPTGRTPTAPGHTTTPSPTWALEVRLPRRPTPLPPDLLVIPPIHPLPSAASFCLLCCHLLFPAAGADVIIKGAGGLMRAVLRPLAHCGCCMLLLLLLALQTTTSETREPRRWRTHWPPGRTPTAPGHTTTPSAP